jgi:lactoylglutathione lyase
VIDHVKTVALYVSDQDKAHDFYVDKLGFEVKQDGDMGPMGRWLVVAPKGAATGLMLASAEGFGKVDRVGDSADLTFGTTDVSAVYERLSAAGVAVTEPESAPWGRFVRVTDPDGHTFLISQLA